MGSKNEKNVKKNSCVAHTVAEKVHTTVIIAVLYNRVSSEYVIKVRSYDRIVQLVQEEHSTRKSLAAVATEDSKRMFLRH